MSAAQVHGYMVSFPKGGYRTFKCHDTFHAYLIAIEDMGHTVTWLGAKRAQVSLVGGPV